jgi:hypothetical protein
VKEWERIFLKMEPRRGAVFRGLQKLGACLAEVLKRYVLFPVQLCQRHKRFSRDALKTLSKNTKRSQKRSGMLQTQ